VVKEKARVKLQNTLKIGLLKETISVVDFGINQLFLKA